MSDVKVIIDGTEYPVQSSLTVTVGGVDSPAPAVGGITSGSVPSAANDVGDEPEPQKRATETFKLDNGTVTAGDIFPAGHVAVLRHPDLFVDVVVEDDVPDGQAISDLGTGTVTPGADTTEPSTEPDHPGFDGDRPDGFQFGPSDPTPGQGAPVEPVAEQTSPGTGEPMTGVEAPADGTLSEPVSNEPSTPTEVPDPAPVEKTLYRHVGDGAVDEAAWPDSGEVNAAGEKLRTFAFEKSPGDGASDEWVVDTAALGETAAADQPAADRPQPGPGQ